MNEISHNDPESGEGAEVGEENNGLEAGQYEAGGCEVVDSSLEATVGCGDLDVAVASGQGSLGESPSGASSMASNSLVGSAVTSSDAVIACDELRSTAILTTASPLGGIDTSIDASGGDLGGGAVSISLLTPANCDGSLGDPLIGGSSVDDGLGPITSILEVAGSEVAPSIVSACSEVRYDDDIMMMEPCDRCGSLDCRRTCSLLPTSKDCSRATTSISNGVVGESVGVCGNRGGSGGAGGEEGVIVEGVVERGVVSAVIGGVGAPAEKAAHHEVAIGVAADVGGYIKENEQYIALQDPYVYADYDDGGISLSDSELNDPELLNSGFEVVRSKKLSKARSRTDDGSRGICSRPASCAETALGSTDEGADRRLSSESLTNDVDLSTQDHGVVSGSLPLASHSTGCRIVVPSVVRLERLEEADIHRWIAAKRKTTSLKKGRSKKKVGAEGRGRRADSVCQQSRGEDQRAESGESEADSEEGSTREELVGEVCEVHEKEGGEDEEEGGEERKESEESGRSGVTEEISLLDSEPEDEPEQERSEEISLSDSEAEAEAEADGTLEQDRALEVRLEQELARELSQAMELRSQLEQGMELEEGARGSVVSVSGQESVSVSGLDRPSEPDLDSLEGSEGALGSELDQFSGLELGENQMEGERNNPDSEVEPHGGSMSQDEGLESHRSGGELSNGSGEVAGAVSETPGGSNSTPSRPCASSAVVLKNLLDKFNSIAAQMQLVCDHFATCPHADHSRLSAIEDGFVPMDFE